MGIELSIMNNSVFPTNTGFSTDTGTYGVFLSSLSPSGKIVLTKDNWENLESSIAGRAALDISHISTLRELLSLMPIINFNTNVWLCHPSENSLLHSPVIFTIWIT